MLALDKEISKTIEEAEKLNNWKYWEQAMKEKLASMRKHNVWDIVSRSRDNGVIKCKWIFDIKEDPNMVQRRYKDY